MSICASQWHGVRNPQEQREECSCKVKVTVDRSCWAHLCRGDERRDECHGWRRSVAAKTITLPPRCARNCRLRRTSSHAPLRVRDAALTMTRTCAMLGRRLGTFAHRVWRGTARLADARTSRRRGLAGCSRQHLVTFTVAPCDQKVG